MTPFAKTFIIEGNANDEENSTFCPFPVIACINEEATCCINEETIGCHRCYQ